MYVCMYVNVGWRFGVVVACSSHERSYSTLSPISTGMGHRLRAGIPPRYVAKLTSSIQPCILWSWLNRVPALIGWGKGGNVTSAGWQVTLCDPIWHVSYHRSEVCCQLLYLVTLLYLLYFTQFVTWYMHCKMYVSISTWRVFHILTEPVPYTFATVCIRKST